MSYAVDPIKTVVVLDPRTRLYNERVYAIFKGGRQVTWQSIVASSTTSTSLVVFNAPPPNSGIIVDRKFWLQCFVQLVFTGTGNPLLQVGTLSGWRQFPVSSCINTTTITINNATFSVNTSEVLSAMQTMNGPKSDYDLGFSMSPSKPDAFQDYQDTFLYGSSKNPLSLYGEDNAQVNRGGFPYTLVNGNNTATATATLTEPIWLSPVKFSPGDEAGFIGVTTIQAQFTMGNLNRMWSHATTANSLSSIVGSFTQSPTMLFTYISPQIYGSIPREILYPYYKLDYTVTPIGSVTSGSTGSITSTSIQFNGIPKAIVLWVRQRTSTQSFTSSDSFAVINSVSMNFNNVSGLLAGATQQQLYQVAVSNGCQLSWPAWSNYRGSVLPIVPGRDLGLDATEAPGSPGIYQFLVNVNFTNTSSGTITYDLYVANIQEGVVTIAENTTIPQVNVLSPKDILDSKASPMMEYHDAQRLWIGGDFYGNLKSFLGRFADYASKAAPYVEAALPYVKEYAPRIASKLLTGVGSGKRTKPRADSKGVITMSRSEMTREGRRDDDSD